MASSSSEMCPSLCIPRVFSNITWQRVKSVFEELGVGEVERVDMVRKENEKGEKFKRVFIHFKHWNKTAEAEGVRQKVLSGESVTVVYDDPWYWKVFKSTVAKPVFEKRERVVKKMVKKPRFGGVSDVSKVSKSCSGSVSVSEMAEMKALSSELAELKALLSAQKSEMEMMRAELNTTKYSPCSPAYSPEDGEGVEVPALE